MKQVAGLWIDHRKAFVVMLSDNGDETLQILSGVDRQPSRKDGVRSGEKFESLQTVADDSRQRNFSGHLEVFYKLVHESLNGMESVLIMGPGEAKGELRKLMDKTDRNRRLAILETDDKMTNPQIVAKVRSHFLERSTRLSD
jgi:hypothetical protein